MCQDLAEIFSVLSIELFPELWYITLEVMEMKKIINPYSIIVSCLLIIIGVVLIIANTANGISVNIGCSLIASGLVLLFSAILIDYHQEYIAWHEWKLEKIFKTRADKNNDSDPKLEGHHVKQLDGIAFGLSSFRSNRSDDVLLCMQSGMNVRLLIMDPNSDFVKQREIEEGAGVGSIAQSILNLVDWANKLNQKSNKGKIQIKFYDAMTLDFYWRMDDEIYVGPYLYGVVSQQTITYKYIKGGKGFALYSKYFEKLWNDSNFSYT